MPPAHRTFLTIALLATATPGALRAQTATPNRPDRSGNPPASAATSATGTLSVAAAIVLKDMTVRPLPVFGLELVSETDTTQRLVFRTALDGTASQLVPVGRYTLRSVQPVALNDSSYRWVLPISVTPSVTKVELTNANAVTSAQRTVATRQVAPEREVFEQVRRAVFRVEAGLGHGSGFLAQIPGVESGLVVTNDHVVANDTIASVYLDSATHVPALVIARDREGDLALLRIPASRCGECPKLTLATPRLGEALVVTGERVMAVGFPLHQSMTLTTGVVSSVRDGAIISDVNINHGNSGGPMLNLAGEVVGVNAFGDFSEQGGPGISGAIAITRIEKLLAQLPSVLRAARAPEDRLLPYMPLATYPLAALKEAAEAEDPKSYRKLFKRDADHFTLDITTPVMYRVFQRMAEEEVAEERRKREAASGVSKDGAYSESKQSRDWEQYVGDANTPVVTIAIAPKIAETGGSAFLRGLAASSGTIAQASYVFQGDVRSVRFYRNGREVEPIFGGHGPIAKNIEDNYVKLKDVADYGYFVLPPELFMPDSNGAPARVRVAIGDLKRPGETSGTEITGDVSARVWNGFEAYYKAVEPAVPFLRANPRLASPNAKMACNSGRCELLP